MLQVDFKSRVPIYEQIVDSVLKLKSIGVLKTGDKLPSVRETAVKLGINPNTVQRAYNMLELRGIIVSRAGKGSFISDCSENDEIYKAAALSRLSSALKEARLGGVNRQEAINLINDIYGGAEND